MRVLMFYSVTFARIRLAADSAWEFSRWTIFEVFFKIFFNSESFFAHHTKVFFTIHNMFAIFQVIS